MILCSLPVALNLVESIYKPKRGSMEVYLSPNNTPARPCTTVGGGGGVELVPKQQYSSVAIAAAAASATVSAV